MATVRDEIGWKNEIMKAATRASLKGLGFPIVYAIASGHPWPGSSPCKMPSELTPTMAARP